MKTLAEQVELTERCQTLLDRRLRLLGDLQQIDADLSAAFAELAAASHDLGGDSLPPTAAAEGPARGEQPEAATDSSKPSKSYPFDKTVSKPKKKKRARGELPIAIQELMKASPRKKFTVPELSEALGEKPASVRPVMYRMVSNDRIELADRGVFRWKAT